MATRTTLNYLDNLSEAPTGAGGDLIYDNFNLLDAFLVGIAGGSSGYVLAKSSASDHDFVWIPIPSAVPDTTNASQGDVLTVSNGSPVWLAPAVAEGTTYSAGTGITIDGTTISVQSGVYAYVTHTHSTNEITGLDSALSTKADSTHTHSTSEISGLATVATSGSYNDLLDKPSDSGGEAGSGSRITECNCNFMYFDGSYSCNHFSGSSPYPAELAHYAGYAYQAASVANMSLNSLLDVDVCNASDGQALVYDSSLGYWFPRHVTTAGTGSGSRITECNCNFTYFDGSNSYDHCSDSTTYPAELAHYAGYAYQAASVANMSLNSLLDVDVCNASEGQALVYDSSLGYWQARTLSSTNLSGASEGVTMCCDSFAYFDGYCSQYYYYGSPPYPAELTHYAGYANTAKQALQAGHDFSPSEWNQYSSSGDVALFASYASGSGSISTFALCPLPSLGPFIVSILLQWIDSEGQNYSAAVVIHGANLVIGKITLLSGSDNVTVISSNIFSISSSILQIVPANIVNARYVTATAHPCGLTTYSAGSSYC